MTEIGSLDVALTSNTADFQRGILSAQQTLLNLEKQITNIGAVGGALRDAIVPIGTAIAAAFASQQALSAYGESKLPGATQYVKSIDDSKAALKDLAAAVGEYLAPAAQRTAELVTRAAKAITPLMREFTAFSRSAGKFLSALGQNVVSAFAPLAPAIAATVQSIKAMFQGPGRDWRAMLVALRAQWNATWSAILKYTAPVLVAAAGAADAAFSAMRSMAIAAAQAIQNGFGAASKWMASLGPAASAAAAAVWSAIGKVASWLGVTLPAGATAGARAFIDLGQTIQDSLVTALVAAEYAFASWRAAADVAIAAVSAGLQAVADLGAQYFGQLAANGEVAWSNLVAGASAMVATLQDAFGQFAKYIRGVLSTLEFNAKLPLANSIIAAHNSFHPFGTQAPTFRPLDLPAAPAAADLTRAYKPEYQPLPGFHEAKPTQQTTDAFAALKDSWSQFADGFGDFLAPRLKEIGDKIKPFLDAIAKNLPKVDGKPTPAVPDALEPSHRRADAALKGTQEAYRAIYEATSPEKDSKQLAEARRQTKLQGQIAVGVKQKPRVAHFN